MSSWLVRFLDSASNDVATTTLGLFWAGLAVGRLLASRVADRFPPVAFAGTCALVAAVALIGAVAAPTLPLSIAMFALCGLAFGPVYPMIMAIGGALYPNRIAAVTGALGRGGGRGRDHLSTAHGRHLRRGRDRPRDVRRRPAGVRLGRGAGGGRIRIPAARGGGRGLMARQTRSIGLSGRFPHSSHEPA